MLSAEGSTPGEKGLRGLPVVFMNEATEAIAAHDRTVGSGLPDWRSAFRDSKIESAMGPLLVVVADIGLQHRFEMAFVQDEDPIETLTSNGTNEPFCISVSPWSPPRRPNDLHILGLEDLVEHGTESLAVVVNEESQWSCAGLSGRGDISGDLTIVAQFRPQRGSCLIG